MTRFNRAEITLKSIEYLIERTRYPYRLFLIDNGSDLELDHGYFLEEIKFKDNYGIHAAWNTALALAESEYFITADNDLYVPDLEPCWLTQMVKLMDNNKDYAAIAAQPHEYLGASTPTDCHSGVCKVSHCGAVVRLMRTDAVRKTGGWDHRLDAKRNHEEKTICGKLRTNGWEVGYAEKIKCYHDFGDDDNWGYKEIHPHKHGHRIPGGGRFATDTEKKGEIWPPPSHLSAKKDLYDPKTWELK